MVDCNVERREISLSHRECRNGVVYGCGFPSLQSLPGKKEERLILNGGSSKGEPIIVAFERRCLGGIIEVPRVELFITEKLVCSAVKEVGSRFHGEVHNSAC